MKGSAKRWTVYGILVGLLLIAGSVSYVYRREIVLKAHPIIVPLCVSILDAPELREESLSPNAEVQADSIHDWVTAYGNTIAEERRQANENKSPEQLRSELARRLGLMPSCLDENAVTSLRQLYRNDAYVLEEVQISVCTEQLKLFGLLASPITQTIPAPMIIALHGTAAGPEVLFDGWHEDKTAAYQIADYHNSMGSVLARAGFTVFAPQLITERNDLPVVHFNEKRNELHMRLVSLGFTLRGIELTMISSALTALSNDSRFSFDRNNVGAYGVSLGGATAFYLAALDERVKATVVSQWIENRDDKLFGTLPASNWRHPSGVYVYVQGFSTSFSDTEMLRLILPRGVFVEAGKEDGQRAESAIEKFDYWRNQFSTAAQEGIICLEVGSDGHEAQLAGAIDWLKSFLVEDPYGVIECTP